MIYRWIRELHLYVGLFLSPFIALFAVTAILFNHTWKPGNSEREPTTQKIAVRVPMDAKGLELAKSILRQAKVAGEIEWLPNDFPQKRNTIPVVRPGERVTVRVDFEAKTAEIERRRTGFWDTLLYLHKSPGAHVAHLRGNWFYTRLWGWLADTVVYLFLFVSASGIYLWTVLRAERKIGLILLGTGVVAFALIVLALVR